MDQSNWFLFDCGFSWPSKWIISSIILIFWVLHLFWGQICGLDDDFKNGAPWKLQFCGFFSVSASFEAIYVLFYFFYEIINSLFKAHMII